MADQDQRIDPCWQHIMTAPFDGEAVYVAGHDDRGRSRHAVAHWFNPVVRNYIGPPGWYFFGQPGEVVSLGWTPTHWSRWITKVVRGHHSTVMVPITGEQENG